MTGHIEKTVFISYRRKSASWAVAIYQNLKSNGFDVFLDYNDIKSGDFEQIITANIKARAHFLVLLTPSALERCNIPEDLFRREIEMAIKEKRNIIPLFLDGFDFKKPSIAKFLIGNLRLLTMYNGLTVSAEYFDEGMTRLREDFLNIPTDTVLHPISKARWAVDVQETDNGGLSVTLKKNNPGQSWFDKAFSSENLEEQIRYYTEAILINPSFVEAYYNRGITRSKIGDINGAIDDYSEAIRLKPKDVNAYWGRGNAFHTKKEYLAAIADYKIYFELGGNDERVRQILIDMQNGSGI